MSLARFDAAVANLTGRRPRLVAGTTWVALFFYLGYHLTGFRPMATLTGTHSAVDFTIQYFTSPRIMATGRYPDLTAGFFPYPPPMVMLFSLFGMFDLSAARALWILVKGAALVGALTGGLRLAGAEARPERWLIAALAVACADPFVHWDLRAHNNVLVYLALVVGALLAARHPWRAGVLLASSVTLKLYSGLFLPWLLWRGRYRWLAASIAVLALLWAGVPVARFGWGGAVLLYREWWWQVAHAGTPTFHASPAPLVTLRHGLAGLFGIEPFGGAMVPILFGVRLGWAFLLARYVVVRRSRKGSEPAITPGDAVVLMLAPLPFSPLLQPPHGAVVLLGTIVLVAVTLDPRRRPWLRAATAAGAVTGLVLGNAMPDFAVRGAVTFAVFAAQVIGLTLLAAEPDPDQGTSRS